MRLMRSLRATAVFGAVALAGFSMQAQAQETVKIGLIAPFTGAFALYGKQMEAGMRAYMKVHGDTVAGKKVEIIKRDTTGPLPDVSKRLAQELVVRDKVDFLAGFAFTPEVGAVAPIADKAKVPMVIMNAAGGGITLKSDYAMRVSMSLPQIAAPMATWAVKNKIKNVVMLISDYSPGIDSEKAFKKEFVAGGGKILDSLHVPVNSPDFAPFIQRIKDLKPDAMFVFVPGGEQGIALMKAYRERGLEEAGIKVIGVGNMTDDHTLPAMGDVALDAITAFHYSIAHKSPENTAFLKAYADVNPEGGRPDYLALGGFDGMAAMYQVIEKLGGKMDGERAMGVIRGMKIDSPRGLVTIDPKTRDIVQTIYIRRVEKVDGQLYNVEFDQFANVH